MAPNNNARLPFAFVPTAGKTPAQGEDKGEKYAVNVNALLASIVSNSEDAIIAVSREGLILSWNHGAEKMYKYTAEEAVGQHVDLIVPEEYRLEVNEIRTRTMAGQPVSSFETIRLAKDGARRAISLSLSPIIDDDGNTVGVSSIARDLSSHREIEARLTASEDRFHSIIDDLTDFVFRFLPSGSVTLANSSAAKFLDCEKSSLDGANFLDLFPGQDGDAMTQRMDLLTPRYRQATFEQPFEHPDGSSRTLEWTLRAFFDSYGVAREFQAVARDVTEQVILREELEKAMEEMGDRVREGIAEVTQRESELSWEIAQRKVAESDLAEREAVLRAALEGAKAALIVADATTGQVVRVNSVAETMLGRPERALEGSVCNEIFNVGESSNPFICPEQGRHVLHEETRLVTAQGSIIPVSRSVITVRLKNRELLVMLLFDITERKELERQLSMAQKLESIGQLAAGISHEINTPIQYVGDNVRFLKDSMDDLAELLRRGQQLGEQLREAGYGEAVEELTAFEEEIDLEFILEEIPKAIQQSLEGVERVATIVQAMKRFSHMENRDEMKTVDLNKAIINTMTVARNEWKYVADLVTDLDPNLPPVPCFPGDLNQVFLNIVVNAAHAIGDRVRDTTDKGQITISTRTIGNHAEIRITDTGTGIPESARSRLFDPFFTTKEVGKGTGQGLAISHNIVVEKHKGSLHFETEMGVGTTFIVSLPLESS